MEDAGRSGGELVGVLGTGEKGVARGRGSRGRLRVAEETYFECHFFSLFFLYPTSLKRWELKGMNCFGP